MPAVDFDYAGAVASGARRCRIGGEHDGGHERGS